MRLGNFTAHVVVNGEPLEEYDVVSESPTESTCWIASEEGKSFGVEWKCHDDSRTTGCRGEVTVDGIACGLNWMSPGALGQGDTRILSQLIGMKSERDLVFTRIELTDDDSLLKKQIPRNLGQIRLTIRRGQIVLQHCPTNVDHQSVELGDNKFHERAKKATVHCIGFGPERARNHSPYQVSLVPNNEPELTFVFSYQPLSVLQANGIARRPIASNATIATSESEDIKPSLELDDRIHNLENELKRLRDVKANGSEERKPKRIKREVEPDGRRRRARGFTSGEVIDLT